MVVREAVGASIPLAGVGCAIAREPLARIAAMHDGRPFVGGSMTEDYELGLRVGALGLKTMFVRIPGRARRSRSGRQPRPFPGEPRRRGSPKGALAGRDRVGRLGPARLARRARRAMDADARPARAARGVAAPGGLCARRSCGRSYGWPKRSARRSTRASIRSWSCCSPINGAARLADLDARLFHHRRLRLGQGLLLDPAAGGRQCRSPCWPPRGRFRSTSAAAPRDGRKPATSSPPSCRSETVAAVPWSGRDRMGRVQGLEPRRLSRPRAVQGHPK